MINTRISAGILSGLIAVGNLFAAGSWLIYGDQSCIIRKDILNTGASYNHPANIEQLANGDLIIVTVAGQSEGESTRIGSFRSANNGDSWGDLINITPVQEAFDPTLTQAENGDVYCFYYRGGGGSCCNNHKFRVSTDNGDTWGSENDVSGMAGLSDDELQAGEQSNCLRHPNGDWLCGWSETYNGGQGYTSHIPKGKLGSPSDWTKHFGIDQFWNPDFMVRNPSNVVNGHYQEIIAVMRTQFHNCCKGKFAYSTDGGESWGGFTNIGFVGGGVGCTNTANSANDAAPTGVSLDLDGGPLLGWHVMASGGEARYCTESGCTKARCERYFMRVFVSNTGDADDWEEKLELREESGGNENADCSIIQAADGKLHLIWIGRGSSVVRYAKIAPGILIGQTTRAIQPRAAQTNVSRAARGRVRTLYTVRGEFITSPAAHRSAPGVVIERRGSGLILRVAGTPAH
ncbi:MAG: hypothetical protein GF398_15230 [Chitinivibrionales bacterium]|nr:hypothetical protein [Chitinivibrionales bacterium]